MCGPILIENKKKILDQVKKQKKNIQTTIKISEQKLMNIICYKNTFSVF